MPLDDYNPIFQAAGNEWNVDPALLKAIAQQESAGIPTAVSKKGAAGLMGLMPPTQADLGVTDPTDPVQSIYGGAKYLSQMLGASRTPEEALARYNAGPSTIDNVLAGKATLPPETQAYVPAVAAHYQQFTLGGKTQGPAAAASPSNATDDAFLAQTGAKAPVPSDGIATITVHPSRGTPTGNPTDDTFLAQTGAAPLTPAPASSTAAALTGEIVDPETGATSTGLASVGQEAVQGVVSGWQGTEPVVTPAVQATLDRYGIGGVTRLATGALKLGGALVGGAAGAVAGGAEAAGAPILGRDLGAMVQNPQALYGTPNPLQMRVQGPQEAPPSPRFVQEIYGEGQPGNPLALPPSTITPNPLAARVPAPAFVPPGAPVPVLPRIQALIAADNAVAANRPAFVPPGTATDLSGRVAPVVQPSNPLGSAAPRTVPAGAVPVETGGAATFPETQSVGAAASREGTPPAQIGLTPGQEQAYRSTAEVQKLTEPQPTGADTNRYVPGVEPTAAHMEQSANVSREQKLLESQIPEEFKAVASANNEARQEFVNEVVPSPAEINTLKEEREAQRVADTDRAWTNKSPADPAPIASAAQDILSGPDGKIRSVKSAVDQLMSGLKNPDGTLETDPQRLYGVRRDLANDYSKAAVAQDATKSAGAAAMRDLLPVVDSAIEKAAPGYRQYMDNYAANSAKIDSAEALNEFVPKLYDTQGRMQLSRVQSMMKTIVAGRAAPGLSPFKNIPDDTMASLWALRDDLRRVAAADELAKARGSDTAQNFMDLAKQGAKAAGNMAAVAAANHVAPVAGPFMLGAGRAFLDTLRSKSAANALQRRAAEMAHPDAARYPPPNPLQ